MRYNLWGNSPSDSPTLIFEGKTESKRQVASLIEMWNSDPAIYNRALSELLESNSTTIPVKSGVVTFDIVEMSDLASL
jgi:hypothetical protein